MTRRAVNVDDTELGEPKIIGRYALYGEIASGGMASVHFGRLIGPVGFSRTVAIKRIHPHHVKDPDFVSMLLDEARLVARIRHPNVVPVLDIVALQGEVFLVMEYVLGETFSNLLHAPGGDKRLVAPDMAGTIVAGVLEGLHAAHEAVSEHGDPLNIVHRDVSPQNILVGADGIPRVLDFGVAKAAGRLQTTRDGQLKGKLPYMAPEQIMGNPVDRRADIFSAGAVLWEALVGRRLFIGGTDAVVVFKVLEEPIESPDDFVDGLPAGLATATMKALERDPTRRYQTARDMAEDIEKSIRILPTRDIGRWVDASASDAIHQRARQVKQVESVSSSTNRADFARALAARSKDAPSNAPGSRDESNHIVSGVDVMRLVAKDSTGAVRASAPCPIVAPTDRDKLATDALISASIDRPAKRSGLALALAVAAVLAVVAVVLTVELWPSSAPPNRADLPSAPTSRHSAPNPPLPPVSTALPVAPFAASDAPAGSRTAPPDVASALSPARTRSARAPATPHATKDAKPPPPPDCNPHYRVDPTGVRIPKPECF
ncbi:MAG: protein kinase [Polyangiaceae bacterium]|nr:protein kinase [Polyangiaceae bacterium]